MPSLQPSACFPFFFPSSIANNSPLAQLAGERIVALGPLVRTYTVPAKAFLLSCWFCPHLPQGERNILFGTVQFSIFFLISRAFFSVFFVF